VTSIRGALGRRLIAALSLGLLLGGAGLYLLCRRLLTAQFDGALAEKARIISALLEDESDEGIDSDLPAMDGAAREPGERYEIWVGDVGPPLRRSPSLGGADLPRWHDASADLTLPDGQPGRAAWLGITVRERPGTIAVARPRRPLDQALGVILSALALVGALLLVGLPLLVWRALGRGLAPLERVAEQAARIEAPSLDRRFPSHGLPAELQPICDRLNDLLGRIGASFDRERRFSADVAHELRTPLAELRTLAEVALRFPEGTAARDALPDVLDATLQMERLVTALLSLARCDAGRQQVARAPVDLGRIATEAWAPLTTQAAARGLVVSAHPASLIATTDELMVGVVFGNLFSNAVAYTPAGGSVAWQLAASSAGLELTVLNDSGALSAADLPFAFERFWRKDAARSDGQHGGLGLSLARAFASLLGGTVTLDLPAPDRVRARAFIPLG
jgi:signal transduction histidine kinase